MSPYGRGEKKTEKERERGRRERPTKRSPTIALDKEAIVSNKIDKELARFCANDEKTPER